MAPVDALETLLAALLGKQKPIRASSPYSFDSE
jgi:hypothetical protein